MKTGQDAFGAFTLRTGDERIAPESATRESCVLFTPYMGADGRVIAMGWQNRLPRATLAFSGRGLRCGNMSTQKSAMSRFAACPWRDFFKALARLSSTEDRADRFTIDMNCTSLERTL